MISTINLTFPESYGENKDVGIRKTSSMWSSRLKIRKTNIFSNMFLVNIAILLGCLVCSYSPVCDGLHLQGTWETDTFFLFLTKFGFQKTESNNKNDTQGYIFGNVTNPRQLGAHSISKSKKIVKRSSEKDTDSKLPDALLSVLQSNSNSVVKNQTLSSTMSPSSTKSVSEKLLFLGSSTTTSVTKSTPSVSKSTTSTSPKATSTTLAPVTKFYPATLVVLDRGYFLDFYRNRNIEDKNEACQQMFEQISRVAYDSQCYKEGTENFLRRIPCSENELCVDDESNPKFVVKEHQFTYAISSNQPKFWYATLVACYRDPVTCEWKHSGNYSTIDYDIWLVNGNPYTKNQNPLEYQFSFDRQDTVEIYLVFFLCYLVLFPLQIHAVLRQRHVVPRLFISSVALELTAVLANVVHVLKFALNGEGHPSLAAFGDIMDIGARAVFMLILLVLAKGWAVTRTELTSKPFIFTIWAVYGVVHILLYVWKETEVDVIEDIDEYQTWPGWLILVLRNIIMVWFLYELKDTMDHEHQPNKLNFFLHFGAASLVWFIYLPIIALIALQVSPLWRTKLLLGITYSADCLAFAVMTHLLWPTRSQQYFLLAAKLDTSLTDELEEFNEAPHVINSYSRRPNHYPINYSFRDVSSAEGGSLSNTNGHRNGFGNGSTGSYLDDMKDNVPLIIT